MRALHAIRKLLPGDLKRVWNLSAPILGLGVRDVPYAMFTQRIFLKPLEELIKVSYLLGKLGPFRGGNPSDPEPSFINSQKPEILPGIINHLLASYITFQVMTVTNVSPGYQHPVDALRKCIQ
jgi:hypothetical protein